MTELVLKVEGLSKKFSKSLRKSLYYGAQDLSHELMGRSVSEKLRKTEFWALEDINFELRKGEMLGLIGANGAGKSTLLKLINGLIKPTKGSITVKGRIGAMIALGTGFNPILTGRENVFVNAAVLGISKKEVDKKLQQILDFAEIGDFIDSPVQNYSSGMKVRLGYAVASNLNPDILLIDEVLSVGDSSFRARCIENLRNYRENGGTIIFVSHNTLVVENTCTRAVWMEKGRVVEIGAPKDVVEKYETKMLNLSAMAKKQRSIPEKYLVNDDISIVKVDLLDMDGVIQDEFSFRESIELKIYYQINNTINNPYFEIAIVNQKNNLTLTKISTYFDGFEINDLSQAGTVSCVIDTLPFVPGTYDIQVGVKANPTSKFGKKWYSKIRSVKELKINLNGTKDVLPGVPAPHLVSGIAPVYLPHQWKVNNKGISVLNSPKRINKI